LKFLTDRGIWREISTIEHIAIIGAGSGGKAAGADLVLQGKKVNLFEFPEYKENLTDLLESKTLIASGATEGEAPSKW
jgi:hypothetical protein